MTICSATITGAVKHAFVFSAALVALSGCGSLKPTPLSVQELKGGIQNDRRASQAGIEPIQGRISLEEAIARALKYNLERRSRMMEEAIAFNQFDASRYDMLPRLVAQAGYRWRDEELITRSRDSVTGAPSLANPFISSERASTVFDLGLTWNLLDFGASYYGARQNADRVQIAAERRRKAMHLLIQDVRSAFWRTASAQRLQQRVKETIMLAEEALIDSRKAETEQVRSPVESLRYQRQVLENLRLLEATNQELSTARLELSHLMNIPMAFKVEVAEPAEGLSPRILELPVERLEDVAVGLNADLRESFYNSRIARDETRRVLLRLFPGISFNYNIKYSTDNFQVNQHWQEAGAVISFNLFNLLMGPSQMKLAEAGVALADQRRMAAQLAVMTQVHIARLQYANSIEQYQRAEAVANVDARLDEIMTKREKLEVQSKLESVANKTTAILSLLRRYQALAQAHSAASRLQATLGIEPEFGSMDDLSLAQLTAVVQRALTSWNQGDLPREETPARGDAGSTPSTTEMASQQAQDDSAAGTAAATAAIAQSGAALVREATERTAQVNPAGSQENPLRPPLLQLQLSLALGASSEPKNGEAQVPRAQVMQSMDLGNALVVAQRLR
jgi:outer membrane protein TolC